MKSKKPDYPYDFRTLSLGKCKELGLKYDRHAGGGIHLAPNSHDYYFPAKLKKFGSLDAIRKHVGALHKVFPRFQCRHVGRSGGICKTIPAGVEDRA